MRIFLDTEFTDFINTELISIGLVTSDGKEFYAERSDYNKSYSSPFVKQVVEPLLGKDPSKVMLEGKLKGELYAWLRQWEDEQVIISVDYNGDWDLFCDLLNGCDLSWIRGQNVNGCINPQVVEQWFKTTGLPVHHALHDALANRFAFVEPPNVEY